MRFYTVIACRLALVSAALATTSQQLFFNAGSNYRISDLNIIVPITVPIPGSLESALGNVTITVDWTTLSILTNIKVYNAVIRLTRTLDFSRVGILGSGPVAPILRAPDTQPQTVATYTSDVNINTVFVDIPIEIPLPGLNSTGSGNANITIGADGTLGIGGSFKIGRGEVGHGGGVTLQPHQATIAKPRFFFLGDQCKVDNDCAPSTGPNTPCRCSGLVGLRTCKCITVKTKNVSLRTPLRLHNMRSCID
jgi:hypothetical protein